MALTYTVTINATPIKLTLNKGTDGLTPYIGENGNWWIGLTDTGVSATPNGIESITLLSTVGLVKTYRILFTDNTHFDYAVSDGAKGDKGDTGDDGLTTSIALNGTTYQQSGGTITLPDLLTPDGDGSGVMAGQNVDEVYWTAFPADGVSWSLYKWFGVIRDKIERLFTIKLDTTGNSSDTTVAFAEAGATALPASGEKQSTLWGKALRYFKTEIPAWITAVYDTIYQQFKETSFQGAVNVYYRYIGTSYVISETAPTTAENAPYALTGTNTTTHTFAGTLQRDGFYSPKSTYTKNIYFTGLTQNTTYNVTTMAYSIKGQQIFSVTGSFSTGVGVTSYLFVMNIPNSLVWQNEINYVIGDAYQEVISISKSSSGVNSTIYISNNPTAGTLSTMTRYGGVIYGTDVFSEAANKTLDGFVTDELNIRSKILNVTATRTLPTDDWTFGAFSTSEFGAIAAIAANGAPIYVRFAGVTGGTAEPVMMYPGLWNETLQQITSRDLARGFYLNGGVASNRGARSYDTQKYIDIGAVFNDVTGYYEYLGLTDNTESACREAYSLWLGPKTPFYFNYRNLGPKKTKFLFPITWVDENMTTGRSTLFYGSARIKRIRLCANMMLPDSPTNLFYAGSGIAYLTASSEITYIGGGIDMKSVVSDANASNLISAGCTHIMLYNCKVNINLSASTVLDYESVLNVPKYSAATSIKTFTLASAVATSARAAYLLNPEPGYATLDLYCQSKNYAIGTA